MATESFVLVISSETGRTRAEGPMNEHQAIARREYLWDHFIGLSISVVIAGVWEDE